MKLKNLPESAPAWSEWRGRYRDKGLVGLVPTYPERRKSRLPEGVVALIEHVRRGVQRGAARTRIGLRRVHQNNGPMATISRTFIRLALAYLPRGRKRARPRQLKLFEKPHPGDSVQMGVKVVKLAGRKAYQHQDPRWPGAPYLSTLSSPRFPASRAAPSTSLTDASMLHDRRPLAGVDSNCLNRT